MKKIINQGRLIHPVEIKGALVDTLGLGFGLWLLGYIAGIALFFTPFKDTLGWVIFAFFTPMTILVAYLRFRDRTRSLMYFVMVGVAWTAIAVVLDYLFIVLLFNSQGYYKLDVFVYYAAMLLIPVGIGSALAKKAG